MRKIFLAVTFLVVAAPHTGAAQVVESPFRYIETRHELGFFAGYLDTNPGRLDLGPRSAPHFGARYDIRLTGPLSGELELGFAPSERTIFVRGTGDEVILEPVAETNTLLMVAGAGFRFHLTGQRHWHNIAPFLTLSGGVIADLTSGSTLEGEIPSEQFFRLGPGFALLFGVGSDFFLSEQLSIRVDIRDHLWRLSYPGGLTETGRSDDEWVHNFAPSLGVKYHF